MPSATTLFFFVFFLSTMFLLTQSLRLNNHASVRALRRPPVAMRGLFGGWDKKDNNNNNNNNNKPAGGGGFGGMMGDMMNNLKGMQDMNAMAQQVNKEMQTTRYTNTDDSNADVIAIYNGIGAPVSFKVSASLCAKGPEAVSAAVTKAADEAFTKAQMGILRKMQGSMFSKGQ